MEPSAVVRNTNDVPPMVATSMMTNNTHNNGTMLPAGVHLNSSCDLCRSRKIKCDGQRPCKGCTTRYMKENGLSSLDQVDMTQVNCVYSPSKRRGQVNNNQNQAIATMMNASGPGNNRTVAGMTGIATTQSPEEIQQQLLMLQQMQQQQPFAAATDKRDTDSYAQPAARRMRHTAPQEEVTQPATPRTITKHHHLLDPGDAEGARLHAYYTLSIDELFRLPPTPTDDEFYRMHGLTPATIPLSQKSALAGSRFAEIALGALVHGETSLGMELCNAVIHCLRDSVREDVDPVVLFTVAKTYFLLGIFRAYRGDMERYYKYRRVAMQYVSKMKDSASTAALLSSISYQDSWAYMIYNGNQTLLPNVDDTIPPVAPIKQSPSNHTEAKYEVKTDSASIAANPQNQCWIQGPPPVYLNNEAPLNARSLDALACAVRTCCDQANKSFAEIAREAGTDNLDDMIPEDTINTPTTSAVLAHENELCSRNVVLSAYTLMQQHENSSQNPRAHDGQQLVISAMDAFLENSEGSGGQGFTDSQIQGLLSVCNLAIENPFLLYHAGPTYHMVTNSVILLCHLLNGLHAMKTDPSFGEQEAKMFDDVFDTVMSIRKLLMIHREKLPVKLRCHLIPRPNFHAEASEPLVDLGETLLCACRGCQGFVLMACSPCVAAERAREARQRLALEAAQEQQAIDLGELDRELDMMGDEFNVDDDELLNMISSVISL